jgi:putative membrane protein
MNASGGTDLGRVVIVCCAADAQLARIHLAGPAAAKVSGYPEDTWLRVEGTVVSGSSTAASDFVPTMNITGVMKIEKPANTYAY